MGQYHPDSIYFQPIMVPHWVRCAKETSYVTSKGEKVTMDVVVLGGSTGTNGILTAPVVEVRSWTALAALRDDQVRGRFIFFNRPMDPTEIETFKA